MTALPIEDEGIDILSIVEATRRWWWLWVLCPIVAVVIGILVTYNPRQPDMYLSTTTILIDNSDQGKAYAEIAISPPIMESAWAENQLDISLESLIVATTVEASTQLVSIMVENPSREAALLYGDAIARNLVAFLEQVRADQLTSVTEEVQANPTLLTDGLYPKFTPFSRLTLIGQTAVPLPHSENANMRRNVGMSMITGLFFGVLVGLVAETYRSAKKRREAV